MMHCPETDRDHCHDTCEHLKDHKRNKNCNIKNEYCPVCIKIVDNSKKRAYKKLTKKKTRKSIWT
jgi:hypothetical protein